MKARVDYDELADEFDQRYQGEQRQGTAMALAALARECGATRMLEVGCGTGHWLAALADLVPARFGLDLSRGMLARAASRPLALSLVQGAARALPFAPDTFDLVYCVNAIHHFDEPRHFIEEAFRLLRPGGALAVIGMDPHDRRACWYVYEYFDGVYERDLARFPTWQEIEAWMKRAGFVRTGTRTVEHFQDEYAGRAVLKDRFLKQKSCSQLALLDDAAYAAGLRRLEETLAQGEATGEIPVFRSEIELGMVGGWKENRGT